jgi:cytochrome P450 family 307 subfamily A
MYLLLTTLKMLLGIKEMISSSSVVLRVMVTVCVILLTLFKWKKKTQKQQEDWNDAPGPKPWPIIGSLHLMAAAQMKGMIPYAAFTALKNIYGNVFSITLGTTKCIVINDEKTVREVLITKDSDFDSRPDFKRFDALFGGDKQNCK